LPGVGSIGCGPVALLLLLFNCPHSRSRRRRRRRRRRRSRSRSRAQSTGWVARAVLALAPTHHINYQKACIATNSRPNRPKVVPLESPSFNLYFGTGCTLVPPL